jgi:hypothetical protein
MNGLVCIAFDSIGMGDFVSSTLAVLKFRPNIVGRETFLRGKVLVQYLL